MDLSREELIEKYPYLTPSGNGANPLVLGAKNLRAELKHAGISAIVRTSRFAGGNSIDVHVADHEQVNEAKLIANKYVDREWDSRDETHNYVNSSWHNVFGSACRVSTQAAWGENLEKLQGTFKAPPKKELTSQEKFAKFYTAAGRGTLSVVAKYVDEMRDREGAIDSAWFVATQRACKYRDGQDVMKLLVERGGIDPNTKTGVRGTPGIHLVLDSPDVAEVLLEAGADPNALDGKKRSPLHVASEHGQAKSVALLLAKGADPSKQDGAGRTALSCAVASGAPLELVQQLLESGADPNLPRDDGKTPMFFAQDAGTAQLLVSAGGDPTILDRQGQAADNWCVLKGFGPAASQDVRTVYRQFRLTQIAQKSRPDDLATPEEALSARQKHGRMM